MRKVISIALFGDSEKYAKFLPAFVRGHHNLFPADQGWELHLHADEQAVTPFVAALREKNLLTLNVRVSEELCRAMLWRMIPVFHDTIKYVFPRDIDAMPMPRDRACVDEFILSKATVSTIHDAPVHIGVMGGLCGFNTQDFKEATEIRTLEDLYKRVENVTWHRHGADQDVLNKIVQNRFLTLLEHRYNGWHAGPKKNQPQAKGVYHCSAWSTPTPDIGWAPRDNYKWSLYDADRLGNHLGCAGFNHEAACRFWDNNGDRKITMAIRECEAAK